jgi:hypothetical protein
MLTKQLLHKLKEKHPEYSEEEIRTVIMCNLNTITRTISKSETFKLVVPKLGTIHTHGNAVSEHKIKDRKYHRKNMKKVNNFTDKTLLF